MNVKKVLTAAAVVGALSFGAAAPAQASKDGELGYHLGCAIGKMLGIQMCGELEPGFGMSEQSTGDTDGSGGGGGGGGGR